MLNNLTVSQKHSHRSSAVILDNKLFRMPSFRVEPNILTPQSSSAQQSNIKPIFTENFQSNYNQGQQKEFQQRQQLNCRNNDQELFDQIKLQRKLALLESTSTVIIEEWKQGNMYEPRCILDQQLDKDLQTMNSITDNEKFKRKQFRDSCGNLFE